MATLGNQKIQDTYSGLLKTDDEQALGSGRTRIQDGDGQDTALKLGKSGAGAEIEASTFHAGGIDTGQVNASSVQVSGLLQATSGISTIKTLNVTETLTMVDGSTFNSDTEANNFKHASAKVGIRTNAPESALDVNGSIKSKGLNVDSQKLFISDNLNYVRMADYGSGNLWGVDGNMNKPKFETAFGKNGKLLESWRYKHIKIKGEAFANSNLKNNPVVIIPAVQYKHIIIDQVVIYYDTQNSNQRGGFAGDLDDPLFSIYYDASSGGNPTQLYAMPYRVHFVNGQQNNYIYNRPALYDINKLIVTLPNKDIKIKSAMNLFGTAPIPGGDFYIRIKYQQLKDTEFKADIDQIIQ